MLPKVSSAVMVRLSPAPALGEPVAGVRTNWVPEAGEITVAGEEVAVVMERLPSVAVSV